ncbi:MAG: hypothetical protein QNJ72_34645 [Pleurocapsa sp. MO_226.B13]|nr:hypothetical protein [Pleurocapsa sp. MO_226.B13]
MFDLQETLERRLAALQGKPVKSNPPKQAHLTQVELNDTSDEYIIRSLTEAGILDEQGNVRKFNFSDRS